MPLIAITREVPPGIVNCELTHLEREPIDYNKAAAQHAEYERILTSLGCTVERLPPLPHQSDSVFVEDAAVVLDQLAIVARPGAESRRGEIASVADKLSSYRSIAFMEAPGTLDGGDVLVIDSTIYVGKSTRTNRQGIDQVAAFTSPYGYKVRAVGVTGCLHLKSAVTRVAADAVLLNPNWVEPSIFAGMRSIEVDPDEPDAANAIWLGDRIVHGSGFEKTSHRLEREGIDVHRVEMSELQKAEGAVTCCSILVRIHPLKG